VGLIFSLVEVYIHSADEKKWYFNYIGERFKCYASPICLEGGNHWIVFNARGVPEKQSAGVIYISDSDSFVIRNLKSNED
jgi:hypothetical protein